MKKIYREPKVRNYDIKLDSILNDVSLAFYNEENVDDSDKSKERIPFSFVDDNDFGFGE